MGIVFFCQSCGARFEVDRQMAGKRGRCRKCGQYTTIPHADEIASMSAMPAVGRVAAPAQAAAVAARSLPPVATAVARVASRATSTGRSDDDEPPPSLGAWLKAGVSHVGLAPLSAVRLPRATILPSALDDAEDSRPYALARPTVDNRGPVRVQDTIAVRLWRRGIGDIQKIFRWLNESAYFLSIPFVMILLFGAAVKNRPVALFGATIVVLLNIGRLAAGIVNLALVPLRDGLVIRKLKKPVRRVVEPAATIAIVALAFTFIPWLSGDRPAGGSLTHRLRAGVNGFEREITGEVGNVIDKAKQVDVRAIGDQARDRLKGLNAQESRDHP